MVFSRCAPGVSATGATLTINRKAATVVADDKSKACGEAAADCEVRLGKTRIRTVVHPTKKTMDCSRGPVAGATDYELQWRKRGGAWKTIEAAATSHTVKKGAAASSV